MKKVTGSIFLSLFLLLTHSEFSKAQSKKIDVENRIKELAINLITPVAPTANFLKAVRIGNLVYLSGHGPDKPQGGQVK